MCTAALIITLCVWRCTQTGAGQVFMYLRSKNIPPPKKNYLFCLLLTGRKEEEEVKQRLDVEGVKKHGAGGQLIIIIS